MKYIYIFLFLLSGNVYAETKFPIYALEDGYIEGEIEWENANTQNTEVMDFQKHYKDCMASKLSVIKNEAFCIESISLSFFPKNDKCVVYYYDVSEVIGENANHFIEREVKKGELIAYTNSKQRLEPIIQDTNRRGCN